ncbi:penicillin acylase family protein [Paucibacter sp. B2R-40]|uniref:penicillin acylase family protein n=1 Tax=Paucibacter sp. B2R-40 TaxID=2893554 RepID=UPI0021E3CE85|nr:penicillin acylase family protein [Paucibacter sp. B2R-40]MCV2355229.1 penicillin acylase family protein [Paucibacter sp. B2R-40]
MNKASTTKRRAPRLLPSLLIGASSVFLLTGLSAWLAVRASLPQIDGSITLPGLAAPLSLERDALGTAVLRGENRLDLARGLGYLHAQERFFEMDLTRRSAAGELSALFGDKALARDKERRVHRLRARLTERLAQMSAADQSLLNAYADGVNAGLSGLHLRPWQYLILRGEPAAWTAVDSLLVVGEMFWMLQGGSIDAGFERAALRERAGDALFDWLNPRGGHWDAALDASPVKPATLPGPALLDLRKAQPSPAPQAARSVQAVEEQVLGSNNWAVAGSRSADGRAILADDMHLDLGVPSIWYRTQLEIKGKGGQVLRAAGLSLPGMPSLVVGSNGQVAWGFTNAYGQWFDWIKLPAELAPARLKSHVETIAIKGAAPQQLDVLDFDGSPIVRERAGQRYALRWVAHLGEAYNLSLDNMLWAGDAAAALRIAQASGIPHQNILVADAKGQIGWSVAGRLWTQAPDEAGYARFQTIQSPKHEWLTLGDYPQLLNPPAGQLWTANNRQLGGAQAQLIGDGGFDLGARAQQIRDRLSERPIQTAASLGAIHFDTEARFIKTWGERLMPLLNADSRHAEAAAQLKQWSGRADAEQVGYRLIRTVRLRTLDALWAAWTTPLLGAMQADEKLRFKWRSQFEYSAVQALTERPAHLLPPGFANWDAFQLAQVDAALMELTQDGKQALAQASWGQYNTSRIQHVMSKAVPALSAWLDMPSAPQGGDANLPFVARPAFGQSQRMVVSPGLEAEATLSMPGGQSGHPLSPFYGAGHADWAAAKPTPLLAGPTLHRLSAN